MKLSEFYNKEKFYINIDGFSFSRDHIITEYGELFVDEEIRLYYRDASTGITTLIYTDVGEWIYLNDNKIICSPYYSDDMDEATHIVIVDIKGDIVSSGALTPFGLIYTKNTALIKEDSTQHSTEIYDFTNCNTPIMFYNDAFLIPRYYPHSDFLYCEFFDYNGNFLKERTNEFFQNVFLQHFLYSFLKLHDFFEALTKDKLTEEQKKAVHTLYMLREQPKKITYELIDYIIDLCFKTGYADNFAVSGYLKIKKHLINNGIYDELLKPLLNIMVINQSGEFGRKNTKFVSSTIAKKIIQAIKYKIEEPNVIITNIDLLWEYMKGV